MFSNSPESFPNGKMLGMDGGSMVFVLSSTADEVPPTLLFLEIETSGVGEEQVREYHTSEAKPGHDIELLGCGNVVIHNRGRQRAQFSDCGCKSVSRSTNGSGEDFGGNQEGDRVGAKLIEETAEEVHGLESFDVFGRGIVLEIEGRNYKEDEVHQKTDNLHPFAAIQLVVNEESYRLSVSIVFCEWWHQDYTYKLDNSPRARHRH